MKILVYLTLFTFMAPNLVMGQNYSTERAKKEVLKTAYKKEKMAVKKTQKFTITMQRKSQKNKCKRQRNLQRTKVRTRRMMGRI